MEDNLTTQTSENGSALTPAEHAPKIIEQEQSELLQREILRTEPEITREQLSLRKRLLNWKTLVPLAIVIFALIFVAGTANINPQQTWNTIRTANLICFAAAFVIYYLSFPIRALRWRLLLHNVGFTKENGVQLPKFWKLTEIIYLSFFANVVVPARLGELYRAYLLREEAGVSATRTFGTVLAERLLDLIVLLLLFIPAVIISLHDNLPQQLRLGLEITLGLVILGVAALFAMRTFREKIAKIVPARFHGHYHHFHEGMLGSFRHIPTLTGLTVAVWTCESLRFFFIVLALNLITGSALHIVTAALVIALGEALLTIIPFTAGGVGLVEGGMAAMILLFNHGTANAGNMSAAAIVLDRSISLLSIWIIGFIVFMLAFGRQTAKKKILTRVPS
jgi:glycosyltransferase 2 family protein